MSDYIHELNEMQRAAVLYNDGPSLVIAGAGSGKTRVLTYKIAYLLDNGYEPWNILALTFTNKAAREMKERIARQVGPERARYLWMGTFHSMFLRILRAESAAVGFPPRFTIYDAADSKSLLRTIIRDVLKLDEKVYKPGTVQGRISTAKNHLFSPAAYAADKAIYEADCAMGIPAMSSIYRIYQERCRESKAMDFDDLLYYTYILFNTHPELLAQYAERFRYILVDEYQDTNVAQHRIVLQLSQGHRHVCVVGDDAQSIYSFRGADIDNILGFTKIFPEARVFKLERNYRSTQTIVSAANSLIANNRRQIPKEVFSQKEVGAPIDVYQAFSDVEESDIVANKITALRRAQHSAYTDFAVLYRTNAQSRVFEEAMRKRGMPYRIYGGLSFYQRKEIKDITAYFRLVVNPHDEEAFKRVINYPPRGIGDTTVGKLAVAALANGVSLWSVLQQPQAYGVGFNKGTLAKLEGFRQLVAGFIETAAGNDACEAGTHIIRQTGIVQEACPDNTPESRSRKENIEELVNGLDDFCARRREEGNTNIGLDDYLAEISLLTDQDSDDDSDEKVTLMTVHSAKGLEFRNVFVVGLEESLFPNAMAGDSMRAMEEERRLFYVAITRAKECLFFSYAKSRYRYGKMEFCAPSRFLKEIDVKYLHLPQLPGMAGAAQAAGEGRKSLEGSPLYRRYGQENKYGRLDKESGYGRFDKESRQGRYGAEGGYGRKPSGEERRVPSSEGSRPPAVQAPAGWKSLSSTKPAASAASGAMAGKPALHAGQHILHDRFGLGEVVRVEGTDENVKATIHFRNAGDKQLLLRFARFKIVDE
ncbi:MAG: UvrD-helicase domain-containing protein [Prevotellaceae bacterium]|nr:UvrD-helicase domain-containing protein [Prevotellaceae bacterium]